MGALTSILSPQLVRAVATLLLLVLAACTSAPGASTDFLVLESQKFT